MNIINPSQKPRFFSARPLPFILIISSVAVVVVVSGVVATWSPILSLLLLVGLFTSPVVVLLLKHPRYLVYVLGFSVAFQVSVDGPSGAVVSPQLGLLAISVPILLLWILKPGQPRFLKTPLFPIWIAYIVIGSISIAMGPSVRGFAQGIWVLYRLVWSAPLIYVLVWLFLNTPRRLRQGIACLVIGATFASIVAVVQILSGGELLSGLTTNFRYLGIYPPLPTESIAAFQSGESRKLFLAGTKIFRAHGTFSGVNNLGVFLSTTFFLAWGLFSTANGNAKWIWFVSMLLIVTGLVATVSRSAWLATMMGALILFLWVARGFLRKRSIWITLLVLVVVFCAVIVGVLLRYPELGDHFLTIFDPANQSEVKWRIALWQYAIGQIQQHPLFGSGTSMINALAANIPGQAERYSSHNLFMDIAYQRGLATLLLYLSFWLGFFLKGWKIIKYPNRQISSLVLGIMLAGVAFLISGIGTPSMTYHNLALLYWFLISIMMTIHQDRNSLLYA